MTATERREIEPATDLTLGEEILLLLVEEDTADLRPVPPWSMACALAGATLMELSMQGRVDTDRHDLTLLDKTPTGCEPLDSALAEIAATGSRTTRHWLEFLARRFDDAREGYLRKLSERGFALAGFEEVLDPIALDAERRGAAVVDVDGARRDLRLRILKCLLTAEIPDARDVMTVCLADACGVLHGILPRGELEGVRPRIALMRRMDQIGRTITEAIWELDPPVPTRRPRAGKPIPEAPGLPLIGSGIGVAKDLGGFLMRQYRRLGPVFGVRLPGRRYVVMAGVDANLLVLRRGRELFHSSYGWHGFAAGFGASRMMIGMDGREHVRLRRAHRSGYARAALTGRTPDLMRIVRAEIQGWNGEPVPVVASVRRMVTEQLGTIVAGFSPRDYADDLGRVLRGLLMTKMLGAVPRAWLWSRSYRRAHGRVRELVERVWNAHLERPEHLRRDLVDDLLEMHAEDPQFLPETDLSVAMLGPFFAGLDTVTAAVSFSLHGLLGHPDLMREATREADEAFAGGTPTAEQFDALDVTRRVVMEALRLYPVSPVALRRAVNAFEFAGHVIPAGQDLMIAFTLPHRLAEVFPDPLRFDIGRFSDSRAEHRRPGAYAPFGLGMHRCLGGNLAESLVVATVAGIVRHARLEPYPANYRLRVRQFPTVIPDGRLRMRATARR
ncbi:MAG: cytochrome P450 [Gammaproteobacteria bacterium]|nr:cytochrome P450 [Gammaproteobacteria bacterium]